MFCDPCTAGPRQFYPLRNNNFNGSIQTTDILSDALKVGIGIHEYNLSGTLYTGNLPTPNYVYGNGTVFKRNSASVMVVLYGALQEPIATNYSSDGQKWLGWNQHALKSDLALLSFTWTGEATNYIDTSITIDGYKPIAITGLNPTGLGTTEALRYFRFNKNNLRAIASFTAKTVTSCIFDVLCIRI